MSIFYWFLEIITYPYFFISSYINHKNVADHDFADAVKNALINYVGSKSTVYGSNFFDKGTSTVSFTKAKHQLYYNMSERSDVWYDVYKINNEDELSYIYHKFAYLFYYHFMKELNPSERTIIKQIFIHEELFLEYNILTERCLTIIFKYICAGVDDAGVIDKDLNISLKKKSRVAFALNKDYGGKASVPILSNKYVYYVYGLIPLVLLYFIANTVYGLINSQYISDVLIKNITPYIYYVYYIIHGLCIYIPLWCAYHVAVAPHIAKGNIFLLEDYKEKIKKLRLYHFGFKNFKRAKKSFINYFKRENIKIKTIHPDLFVIYVYLLLIVFTFISYFYLINNCDYTKITVKDILKFTSIVLVTYWYIKIATMEIINKIAKNFYYMSRIKKLYGVELVEYIDYKDSFFLKNLTNRLINLLEIIKKETNDLWRVGNGYIEDEILIIQKSIVSEKTVSFYEGKLINDEINDIRLSNLPLSDSVFKKNEETTPPPLKKVKKI